MDEKLAEYSIGATKAFSRIVTSLNKCRRDSGKSNGQYFILTVRKMSFRKFSRKSAAYNVTVKVSGATVSGVFVVVSTGSVVMGIEEATSSTPVDLTEFTGLLRTALGDLTAGGTKKSVVTHNKSSAASTTTAPPTTASVPSTLGGTAHPTLAAGAKGKLDVIYTGKPVVSFTRSQVPVEIWNGTSTVISEPDISGSASSQGNIVGSGDSQEVEPRNLFPGQVAFGMVYFEEAVPLTATLNLTATGKSGQDTYFLDAKIGSTNVVNGSFSKQLVGTFTNPSQTTMTGPIQTDAYCFTGGTFVGVRSGFASGSATVPPGGTGSFSIGLTTTLPCSSYLVGASGYGKLHF